MTYITTRWLLHFYPYFSSPLVALDYFTFAVYIIAVIGINCLLITFHQQIMLKNDWNSCNACNVASITEFYIVVWIIINYVSKMCYSVLNDSKYTFDMDYLSLNMNSLEIPTHLRTRNIALTTCVFFPICTGKYFTLRIDEKLLS